MKQTRPRTGGRSAATVASSIYERRICCGYAACEWGARTVTTGLGLEEKTRQLIVAERDRYLEASGNLYT